MTAWLLRCSGLRVPQGLAADLGQSCDAQSGAVQFDRVLLDVPCSGTGVLGKRADMRWQRSGSDMKELKQLQVRCVPTATR